MEKCVGTHEAAAERLIAAEEQVEAQDWTGREKPCPVQVALARIREEKRQ